MPSIWYILACIFIPALWGIAVAAIYEAMAARRRVRSDAPEQSSESSEEL